jgi:hypothetical protein
MRMTAKVKNMEKIQVTFRDLPTKINDNVLRALEESASDLRNEMIISMEKSPIFPTSNKYKVGGETHVASAPGYPPRRWDGGLIASFLTDVDRNLGTVEVGATPIVGKPPYPKFLEEGTSKMEARPYMKPALDKLTSSMKNRVMNAIKESIE